MPTELNNYSISEYFALTRAARLQRELTHALGALEAHELRALAHEVAMDLGRVTLRRGRALGGMLAAGGRWLGEEGKNIWQTCSSGPGMAGYLQSVARRSKQAGGEATDFIIQRGQALKEAIQARPKQTLSELAIGGLFFVLVGGGLDGDGGLPDTDIALGIEWHRSPLTHSFLAGVAVEVILLAVCRLAERVHTHLPAEHDPLWERLRTLSQPLSNAAMTGASCGLAYHLLVDALLQPAPYHGLPVSMPLEAHQVVFAANGLTEAVDLQNRSAP